MSDIAPINAETNRVFTFAGFAAALPIDIPLNHWTRGDTVINVNGAAKQFRVYNVSESGHKVGMIRAKDEADALAIAAILDDLEKVVQITVDAAKAGLDGCCNRGIGDAAFNPHREADFSSRARTMLAEIVRAHFEDSK